MSSREALATLAAAAVALLLAGCGTVASGSPAAGKPELGTRGLPQSANADALLCQNPSAAESAHITHVGGIRAYSEYPSGHVVTTKGPVPGYPAVPVPAVTTTPRYIPQPVPAVPVPRVTSTPRPGIMPGGLLPGGVEGAATASWLAKAACALPLMPQGVRNCPITIFNEYIILFTLQGQQLPAVTVQTTGCRQVTGLGPARSALHADALLQKLAQLTAGIDNGGPMHRLGVGS
jgi:hypothetical protein